MIICYPVELGIVGRPSSVSVPLTRETGINVAETSIHPFNCAKIVRREQHECVAPGYALHVDCARGVDLAVVNGEALGCP